MLSVIQPLASQDLETSDPVCRLQKTDWQVRTLDSANFQTTAGISAGLSVYQPVETLRMRTVAGKLHLEWLCFDLTSSSKACGLLNTVLWSHRFPFRDVSASSLCEVSISFDISTGKATDERCSEAKREKGQSNRDEQGLLLSLEYYRVIMKSTDLLPISPTRTISDIHTTESKNLLEVWCTKTSGNIISWDGAESFGITTIIAASSDIVESFITTRVQPWVQKSQCWFASSDQSIIDKRQDTRDSWCWSTCTTDGSESSVPIDREVEWLTGNI